MAQSSDKAGPSSRTPGSRYPVPSPRLGGATGDHIRLTRSGPKRVFSIVGTLLVAGFVSGFWYLTLHLTGAWDHPITLIASVIGSAILITQLAFLHRELSIRSLRLSRGRVQRVTTTLGIPRVCTYPAGTRFTLVRERLPSSQPTSSPEIERVIYGRVGRATHRVASARETDNLSQVIRFLKSHPGIIARDASGRAPINE